MSRVRLLYFKAARAQRLERQGNASLVLHGSKASGKLVFEGQNIHHSYEDKPIADGLNVVRMRETNWH